MLESYFQNMSVSMTKEQYFEMCEALGTVPIEDEIPIELEDFPIEVQEALNIYFLLRDEWDSFNGRYIGKSLIGLLDILDIFGIKKPNRKYVLEYIITMDKIRTKIIAAQKPKSD